MRKIKFRAWDSENNLMIPNVAVYEDGNHIGFGLSTYNEIYGKDSQIELETNGDDWFYILGNFELMQLTGLLDKNEKMIYEGDILRVPPEGMWGEMFYIVEFWMGCFTARDITSAGGLNNYPNNFNFNATEVIGNIYENMDLFDGAKNKTQ